MKTKMFVENKSAIIYIWIQNNIEVLYKTYNIDILDKLLK